MIGGVLTERTVGTVLPAVKENMAKLKVLFASMVLRIWARRDLLPLACVCAPSGAAGVLRLLRRLMELMVGEDARGGQSDHKSLGSNAVPCGSACVLYASRLPARGMVYERVGTCMFNVHTLQRLSTLLTTPVPPCTCQHLASTCVNLLTHAAHVGRRCATISMASCKPRRRRCRNTKPSTIFGCEISPTPRQSK